MARSRADEDSVNGEMPEPVGGHEVEVVVRLSNRSLGERKERDQIVALEDQLAEVLERTGAGECEGDEFGEGECIIYFTGPDAERLFLTLQPHLQKSPLCRGAHAIKRYGCTDESPQERVRL